MRASISGNTYPCLELENDVVITYSHPGWKYIPYEYLSSATDYTIKAQIFLPNRPYCNT